MLRNLHKMHTLDNSDTNSNQLSPQVTTVYESVLRPCRALFAADAYAQLGLLQQATLHNNASHAGQIMWHDTTSCSHTLYMLTNTCNISAVLSTAANQSTTS
jgi:hypothetical protein